MAIPIQHKGRYIFHFSDLRNLDSIINKGLLCKNLKDSLGIAHKNIANFKIQQRRAEMVVTAGPGGYVHDYVPFYFSSINPMLLTLLNKKNVDQNLIIYFCVNIQRLEKSDTVFSNSSANTSTPPFFYDDVSMLDNLNWNLIESKRWSVGSDEEKHMKMAEAFIHKSVSIGEIDAIVVYNDWAKKKVQVTFEQNHLKPPRILFDNNSLMVNYRFYYTKFFFKNRNFETLVTGPLMLYYQYNQLMVSIKKKRQSRVGEFRYSSIQKLNENLAVDISVIPELGDIVGLLQDYTPHHDTVDYHTKKVVEELKKLELFKNFSTENKNIILLAAYLHDIGKGPISKWESGKMTRDYPDHTVDAIPMLERILVEDIESLTDEEIRLVCMLVVYHDIVGDCIERERSKEQIIQIIENENDLKMLFAISVADSKAILNIWAIRLLANQSEFISEIMETKKIN